MEDGACDPFGVPFGVMSKNMEGSNMKLHTPNPQGLNYLRTQGIGIPFQLSSIL